MDLGYLSLIFKIMVEQHKGIVTTSDILGPPQKTSNLLQRTIQEHEEILQHLHGQQQLVEFQLCRIQKKCEVFVAFLEELKGSQQLDLLFQIIKNDNAMDSRENAKVVSNPVTTNLENATQRIVALDLVFSSLEIAIAMAAVPNHVQASLEIGQVSAKVPTAQPNSKTPPTTAAASQQVQWCTNCSRRCSHNKRLYFSIEWVYRFSSKGYLTKRERAAAP